jgi:hypothetical protein
MKRILLFLTFIVLTAYVKAQFVADGVLVRYTYGTSVTMDTTGMVNALTSSATAGFQTDRVDNTATLAGDFAIAISIQMKAGAPANDKAVYVFAIPWYYDGSTWYAADGGTATLPSGTRGTYTMASPNDFTLLGILKYTTSAQPLQGVFNLRNAWGPGAMPHGWSLFINNFSGIQDSTINVIKYVPTF